jgi:hypothetical protein
LEKALVFRNALFVGSIAALAANNITPQRQPSVGAARESPQKPAHQDAAIH